MSGVASIHLQWSEGGATHQLQQMIKDVLEHLKSALERPKGTQFISGLFVCIWKLYLAWELKTHSDHLKKKFWVRHIQMTPNDDNETYAVAKCQRPCVVICDALPDFLQSTSASLIMVIHSHPAV